MKRKLFLVAFVVLLGLCFAFPVSAERVESSNRRYAKVISAVKGLRAENYQDISQQVMAGVIPTGKFGRRIKTFSAFRGYYRTKLSQLSRIYPAGTFQSQPTSSGKFEKVMNPFRSVTRYSYEEVHVLPFLPITLGPLDPKGLKLSKFKVRVSGKTIHGLSAKGKIRPGFNQSAARMFLDLAYLPTANALLQGFSHGQIIEALSDNIRPAHKYYYNGLLDWKTHQRNDKNAQFARPIPLTNFCHTAGVHGYVVSTHPDFAVEIARSERPSFRLAFFLWKLGNTKRDLPDFIYQVELAR